MIKRTFIKKQIEISKRNKSTSPFLRRLILLVVDRSLKLHYGDSYSMKCLQSSVAIRSILDMYKIKSREYVGALCVSQAFERNDKLPNWNGFWDKDHHVWLHTEYGELVDLTINALHLHPASKGSDQLPVPAVWWGDVEHWPKLLKYLPDAAIKLELPEEEQKDLEAFTRFVKKEYESVLQGSSVNDIKYEPILHGVQSCNELHASGNQWLVKSYILQESNMPYPEWIQNRHNQLMTEYANKTKT